MESTRLASLADLFIAGVLSAAEMEELCALLLASPAAREQFDRQIEAHRVAYPAAVFPSAVEFLEMHLHGRNGREEKTGGRRKAARPPEDDGVSRERSRTRRIGLAAGMAACVVVALGWLVLRSTSRPLPRFAAPAMTADFGTGPVAILRHAADVQWLDRTNEILVGESLAPGEINIAAGVLQLQFNRGARLVVEGPAHLQLVSENETFLHAGRVSAFVPEEAHGFKVMAPAVAVTDLGTEFSLHAPPDMPAEVHVFSGVVEMARPTVRSERLTRGEAVRLAGRKVRSVESNRSAFVFEEELQAMEREAQRRKFEEWKVASGTLSADPTALIHCTFELETEPNGRLVNAAERSARQVTGTVRAKWGSGRWPGKRAIVFESKEDRIGFNVPNTLTSLTYMAWLRVDDLTSVSNALAITQSGQLGEVHWQIYRDGRIALSAHSGRGGTVDDQWDRGLSPAIFTPGRLGRWTHLTSVFDAAERTIKHYVNGELVSATPIKRPLPLKLGAVDVANWGTRGTNPEFYNRHWRGSIDEFALLARAMQPDEIRRYYQAGRVASGTLLTQR